MPLLTIFLLIAACLPINWRKSLFGLDQAESAAATAVCVLMSLALAFALRTWVVITLSRDPLRRSEVGRVYVRVRMLLYYFNIGVVIFAVLALGWGDTAQRLTAIRVEDGWILPPFAELLVPLPYFVILVGIWAVYYDAERALNRAMLSAGRPFWSRAGYVLHQARQTLIFVLMPVGLFVVNQGVYRWYPQTARSGWFQITSVVCVLALVILMPLLLRPLLGLRPLPAGPTRSRLMGLAERVGFRFSDLLVWPTRGGAVNAMILGLVPRVRFVIFTDRILEEMPPEQLDAVFGHEAGHARHGHIRYYLVFLMLSVMALSAVATFADQWLKQEQIFLQDYETGVLLSSVFALAAYLFLVFGFLSRKCERQADVFGAWAVSCGNPHCTGHDEDTIFPHGRWQMCPTGLRTLADALERVHLLNGYGMDHPKGLIRGVWAWFRAWLHGPIPRRVAFLLSLIDRPARERRFQRGVTVLRWGLMLALVAVLIVFGELVGWKNLVQSM